MSELLEGMERGQEDKSLTGSKGGRRFASVVGNPGDEGCLYHKKEVIGRGASGVASRVVRVSDGKSFVAKEMDLEAMSVNDRKYALNEIQCLANCKHFGIIQLEQDYEEDGILLIIMEYANAGDLRRHIKARASENFRYFPDRDIWQIFVQLVMAVDHIHQRRMLHRDIKAANVFLNTAGLVKLGDFGFSSQYEETVSKAVASSLVGTPYYLAPELWRGERYSKKADVWALGILLYELIALRRPFEAGNFKDMKERVLNLNVLPPLPTSCNPDLANVVPLMLNIDPQMRPSMRQLLSIPAMQTHLEQFRRNVLATTTLDAELRQTIADKVTETVQYSKEDPDPSPRLAGGFGVVQNSVTHEGSVKKESGGTWKERYLMLEAGELTISVRAGEGDAKKGKPLSLTDVKNIVRTAPTAHLSGGFVISTRFGTILRFQVATEQELQVWLEKLNQALGLG